MVWKLYLYYKPAHRLNKRFHARRFPFNQPFRRFELGNKNSQYIITIVLSWGDPAENTFNKTKQKVCQLDKLF